jgi:parvulin-like peptidyl-prolyl isomerase
MAGVKTRRGACLGTGAALLMAALVAHEVAAQGQVRPRTPAIAGPAAPPAAAAPANAPPADSTLIRSTAAEKATGQSKISAVVNQEPISRQELADECLRRHADDVIQAVVNKHLILQECEQKGIVITEKDVEAEIDRMAAKFGLSTDRYLKLFEDERRITRDQYARDIIWPTLALRRLVADSTEVTREELAKAWESEVGPRVEVRLITAATREKAEQLRAQAAANPDTFGELAKNHSEDKPSAAARGMIPPIRKHVGNPELERIAFSLKPKEISPVIAVDGQFAILKCEKHVPAAIVAPPLQQQYEETLRERIREEKLRDAAGALFQHLQDHAQIVNVINDPQLRQQMPGIAATINGRKLTMQQLAEECIARHGAEVLHGEINRKILEQELKRRRLAVTQQDIDAEVARAAEAFGYVKKDLTPDVDQWFAQMTEGGDATDIDIYIRDAVWPSVALKKLVGGDIQVTDEDLKKGFEANFGERVEVLAIVLGDQRQAQTVWEMARDNPTEQFFAQLARQYSIEPVSQANGGAVPPIRRHGGQPALENEAFRLEPDGPNALSAIVNIGGKSIIMRCLGRTKPEVTDFNLVRDELYKDIHEKKLRLAMAEQFDRLVEGAQIDNFLTGSSQIGKRVAGPELPSTAEKSAPAKTR